MGGGGVLLAINNVSAESAADISDDDTSVSADTDAEAPDGTDSAEVKVNVVITSMLSLAAYPVGDHSAETDQVNLNVIPGGGLATNMLDLVVRTNVTTGYQLSIKDKDTSADLVNTADATKTIPTLEASTNTAGFPMNRWGYSVGAYDADNSEFYGVPVTDPAIIAKSDSLAPGNGETTTVTFGVKVDPSTPAGTYDDVVLFTASPKLVSATYGLTIHYRYDDGTEAAPDHTATMLTGESYSVTSPEIDDYYPNQTTVTGVIGTENVEITVTYSKYYSATVKYIYEDGSQAFPDVVKTNLKTGDSYSVESPEKSGYYVDKEIVSGTITDQNVVETVTYSLYYTATVSFVDDAGTEIAPAQSQTDLRPGDTYSFTIPEISGYHTDETSPLTGTITSGNVNLTVQYYQYYTLNINFVDASGNSVASAVSLPNKRAGDSYSVNLPTVSGYYTNTASPLTGTVNPSNLNISVTYLPYYSATVTYKYENGSTAATTAVVNDLKPGDSYNIGVPTIPGYYADTAGPITGTISSSNPSNFSKDVTYKPYRTMTVKYQTRGGTTVQSPTTQANLKTGDTYTVTAPTISGYTAEKTTYTGTVPSYDFTVTIYYGKPDFSSSGMVTMQDMTPTICADIRTPSTSETTTVPQMTLTDDRDSRSYTIRKLADGKCWMTQDLNLLLSPRTGLSPDNTDLPAGSAWWYPNATSDYTGNIWDAPSADTDRSYTDGTRTYYNWRAATAGTTSSTNKWPTGSICPKGWTLPSIDDYTNLIYKTYGIGGSTGISKLRNAPLYFSYTGYYLFSDGSITDTAKGIYATRTPANLNDYMMTLDFSATFMATSGMSVSRGNGYAIRCISK